MTSDEKGEYTACCCAFPYSHTVAAVLNELRLT